jgi:hypothetical protein
MGHAYLTLDGQIGRFVVVCAGDNGDNGMASIKLKGEFGMQPLAPPTPPVAPTKNARGRKAKV